MIGNKSNELTATESWCLLKTSAESLLIKSPMNSSPKSTGEILYGLGRGAIWALTRSRLLDRYKALNQGGTAHIAPLCNIYTYVLYRGVF